MPLLVQVKDFWWFICFPLSVILSNSAGLRNQGGFYPDLDPAFQKKNSHLTVSNEKTQIRIDPRKTTRVQTLPIFFPFFLLYNIIIN